jgi:hypothetical protein
MMGQGLLFAHLAAEAAVETFHGKKVERID